MDMNVLLKYKYVVIVSMVFWVLTILQWQNSWFAYDLSMIHSGEYWRVITAHFVHSNLWHAVMNYAALLVICSLFPSSILSIQLISSLVLMSLIVSTGFYFLYPQLGTYVGLSGVLHGLLVWLAFVNFKYEPRFCSFLIIILIGKVLYENIHPASTIDTQQLIGVRVSTESHWIGAISGGVSYMFLFIYDVMVKYK